MTDKLAVITGGGRGIGAGIAEKLAAENWNIAICSRTSPEDLKEYAASLTRQYGVKVSCFQCDISKSEDRKKTFDAILNTFGSVDALINNAGVAPKVRTDVLDMTEESFDYVMNINLRGSFFFTQLFARYFAEQRKGTVINISSCSATVASVSRGEYCMSKAGVSMATKLWAVRLAEFGVNVYEIRPGIIHTDMTKTVQDKYDKLIAEGLVPQARWGFPDDIGKAAAALLRNDLPYSTGQVIHIDGGMNLERL